MPYRVPDDRRVRPGGLLEPPVLFGEDIEPAPQAPGDQIKRGPIAFKVEVPKPHLAAAPREHVGVRDEVAFGMRIPIAGLRTEAPSHGKTVDFEGLGRLLALEFEIHGSRRP